MADTLPANAQLERLLDTAQSIYKNKIPVGDLKQLAELHGTPTRETYADLDLKETPQVMGVAASTVASFALGVFEKDGKPYIVLQRRTPERQYFGKGPYGLLGGFVNNGEAEEQLADGCIRKTQEYTAPSNAQPDDSKELNGLTLQPSQLKLRNALMDYDHVGGEPRSTSTFVSIASCHLTPDQVGYIEKLSKAMENGLEVPGIEGKGYDIIPLAEAAKKEFSSKFTHAFAYEAVKALNDEITRGLARGQSLESLLDNDGAGIVSSTEKQKARADNTAKKPKADAPLSPQLEQLAQAADNIYPNGIPVTDLHKLAQSWGQDPKAVYGFSTIAKSQVMGVPVSTVGSFTFGVFEENHIPYVVLQHRDKERQYNGKGPYGIWGGFLDNGEGQEQPSQACIREAREETQSQDSKRFPGLKLEPSQLKPRAVFMDYDHTGGEPRSTSTAVSVFGCQLNPKQVNYVKSLSKAIKEEDTKVHEVEGYDIIPLSEAAKKEFSSKFTHSFAYDAIKTLNDKVAKGQSLDSLLGNGAGLGR